MELEIKQDSGEIQEDLEVDHIDLETKQKLDWENKNDFHNFVLLKVLGKGNFGKVILSKSKNTDRLCAIKVLKKDNIIQNHDLESARAEKKVFLLATKTKHPFLTNLYCSFQTENRIYFAMEFIGGGDLMWHVQNQRLSVRRAKFYAAEVLLALKYFHDNGVIYRDLKLENILLTPEGHIKIADYGLCKDEMWYGQTLLCLLSQENMIKLLRLRR
uniref:non-specific serine/threonine protein kinase n=1 Tax=Marmota marmota marmota TaxID=9994 RepID=A0A8C5Z2I8_MARMA